MKMASLWWFGVPMAKSLLALGTTSTFSNMLQPIALALPALREQPKLVPRVPRAAPPVLLGPIA